MDHILRTVRLIRWVPLVFADEQADVAQRQDSACQQSQRQRLSGQVQRCGLDVFAEKKQSEQAGRQRIEDREPWLRCGQGTCGQCVRSE
jgi:hypothetical protein